MKLWFLAVCVACIIGCSNDRDEIQELRNAVVVQGVQLQDARERIHVLEKDMDSIAPHRITVSPTPPASIPVPVTTNDARYQVTAKDEEVYRKLKAVGCGIECDAEHPPNRYHCGVDEIAWEHVVSPGDVTLNCLYSGKTAAECHEDCR